MEKVELVKKITEKYKIEKNQAELVVNEVLVEMVSPFIFRKPGGEVGLLNNDCKAPGTEVERPIR